MRRVAVSMVLATLFAASPALGQSLVRYPYPQRVSTIQATLVWRTDQATDSVVRYGSSPSSLDQTITSGIATTQHEVVLTGLSPATRYYYAVGHGGADLAGADAEHYLETAPTVGTPAKTRMWVVGDSGTGGTKQGQVRDAMIAFSGPDRPQLFLHVGDMAYSDGTTSEFTSNFFAPYADVLRHTVCWPAMGNHEGHSSDSGTQSGPYYDAYVLPTAGEAGGLPSGTEAYYSFDWGNAHFVVLDSHDSDRSPGGSMLTWMQQDLQATDQDWIIAYWHHPPYTKGSHDSDNEGQLIDMRENALPILEAAGVDLVLGGHSHIYERSYLIDGAYDTPTTAAGHVVDGGDGAVLGDGPYQKSSGTVGHEGTVYIVAGHGGTGVSGPADHPIMHFSEVDHGSVVLDLQGNRLGVANVRWDGVVSDRMSLVKGTGLVLGTPDGGESYGAGQMVDIAWATVGTVAEVDLDLSTDAGATWTPIAEAVPNTGSYSWTIPFVETNDGLVRVSSSASPSVEDESNARFIIGTTVTEVVVTFGSMWRYDDGGVDHGDAWLDAAFDDAAWAEGPAELGYGDGDESTTLDDATVQPSYYFRRSFTLEGTPIDGGLRVVHDDGVAVWINGTPVLNVYADDTSFGAFADSQSSDNELSSAMIGADVLVEGSNVITAMVKQASAGSSDVSFDLELTTTIALPPPPPGTGGGGGDAASGGAGAAAGGNSGAGGASNGAGGGSDGGCGCSLPGHRGGPMGALAGLALMGLALARRRRR
jgi:Calcineurin-like phosphoesterase/Purple acid Phosphatase, N-terminal domain